MEFKTRELFLVRPSIVTYDNIISLKGEKRKHIVIFENNSNHVDIVEKETIYRDVFNDKRIINDHVSNHCLEGDSYINVFQGDIEPLSKALIKSKTPISELEYVRISEYIISLKPYYTKEELEEILKYFKDKFYSEKPKVKTKTLFNIYKSQMITSRNMIYTDMD